MQKTKKTILIAIMICLVIVSVCSAGSDVMEKYRMRKASGAIGNAIQGWPSVEDLLDRYTRALDSTASFIEHYERTGKNRDNFPPNHPFYSVYGGKKSRHKSSERGTYKFKENEGYYHREYAWGYFNQNWKNVPEDKPVLRVWIHTMDIQYFHQVNNHLHQTGSATWSDMTKKTATIAPPSATVGIAHLLGYIDSDERLDALLRKADSISLRKRTARVGGSDCFVLQAHTKYGQYTVWLDPNHGYHPAKVRHEAKAGEYLHHHIIPAGSIGTGYLDVLKFKKVDGIWVPVEARAGYHRTMGAPKYYMGEDKHYKRTKIVLNPDHDKLGSFADPIFENPTNDSELVNGTVVELWLSPNKSSKYTWQDGKLVDADGKKVDMEKIRKQANNAKK